MQEPRKITSALISVFYKTGLEQIVQRLHDLNVTIYSTGGTEKFIKDLGLSVIPVEEITHFPPILDGRVKTLHPAVFGGILSRRHFEHDTAELVQFDLPLIDLVIVDLYPFEESLNENRIHDELIEKIDIGGVSLIRASAKNYRDVLVISSKEQYPQLEQLLNERNEGNSWLQERQLLAAEAFSLCARYDTHIAGYLHSLPGNAGSDSKGAISELRYGENPHQKGYFQGDLNELLTKLSGKELSFNNLVDCDAGIRLIDEFTNEPTVAILKHTNACGLASRQSLAQAWVAALAGDPVSAFGGVIVVNQEVDLVTAKEINNLFFEVLVAPSYEPEALDVLKTKKNRILLRRNPLKLPSSQTRSLLNGMVRQQQDLAMETRSEMRTVTVKPPSEGELHDLEFALKIVKHTKSNAIILARNLQLLGSGVGQTSRVDALRQAIEKATTFKQPLHDSVMASDAFFPFPDCVEIAAQAGVTAIVEPGGSIKDQDSIDAANSRGVAMVFTGVRHFKH